MSNNYIYIKHVFEGFHRYVDAPDEVAYLRNTHRHLFEIKVYLQIYTDDRDVEFHMFKNDVIGFIRNKNFNEKSCEMISNILFKLISAKYPGRDIKIELSEDGECGVEMYYKKSTPAFDGR